jgi:hypothetical protein
MQQRSLATDLDLQFNPIGNEGASLLARSLGNNAQPNLTSLSLSGCNDGFIALVSALEQNTSLLQLDLANNILSERAILTSAESLPEIKVLQRFELSWSQILPRPCFCCRQDCARIQACFVFALPVVHLLRSHQQLKRQPDTLAAGCRKWNVWSTGTAFSL